MQRLDCTVQDYAWGDPESIPRLLGYEPTGTPAAELWMGAHPKAPSRAIGDDRPLNEVIDADPASQLGAAITERFGQLPFLFKILAAAEPLSIQSHPSLDQAKAGFAREEAAGVALGAFERTYRDANHKPELICALTPFAAKVGFKSVAEARALFALLGHTGLAGLRTQLDQHGDDASVLSATLAWLLGLDSGARSRLVSDLLDAVSSPDTSDAGAFAAELAWVPRVHEAFPGDIGGVVALLLNHVELAPGEAVYLGAGNLHAYLSGTGVELMANSDNVVRGGLTPKNIDIDELLDVVDATPLDPQIQRADSGVHTYESPVAEFSLTRITDPQAHHERPGPHIAIATGGTWTVSTADESVKLAQGEVVFVAASEGAIDVVGQGAMFVASPGHLD